MKARAASGLTHDPTHHGTLPCSPEGFSTLLSHAIDIDLLTPDDSLDEFSNPRPGTARHINLSPTELHG